MTCFSSERGYFAKWILAGPEFDTQRCPDQREGVPEMFFEITFVIVADIFQTVSVNDDYGRILSPLMGISQLRPDGSLTSWRLLIGHRFLKNPRQARRRKFGHGCGIGGYRQNASRNRYRSISRRKHSGILQKTENASFASRFRSDFLALVAGPAHPIY